MASQMSQQLPPGLIGINSNMTSALKKVPVFANNLAGTHSDLSSSTSHLSYEDGFQDAEYNALTEEERARIRKEEKERRLKEF